jgi:PAS domain S-box-containing protein
MNAVLYGVFDTSGFPARWHCGNWSERLGWLHIVSDIMIFGAYMAIPIALGFFIQQRRDLPKPFPVVFWLFGAFIVCCGLTHAIEAIIFWEPIYRAAGVVKAATAAVSWTTLAFLVPAVPKALALRSPQHLERQVEQATAELRRERDAAAHLARIVESSQDAIISQGLDGRIRSWNPGAFRMFGYAPDEIVDQRSDRLVPGPRRTELAEALERARQGHVINALESDWLRKDGSAIAVSATIFSFSNERGELNGVAMIVRDITSRKREQDALQAKTAELQRSNEELEQFAYIASHDLQEPLRMVVNFMDLLKRGYAPNLDELANKYIEFAVDGAARMKQLIDALLTYSRVDGRGGSFGEVSLQDAYRGAMDDLRHLFGESGASIESDELPVVWADPRQMQQVFQNLLANAIKFRGEAVPHIRLECEEHAAHWELRVRDNGIGFEPRHAERIFQMFQRLHERSRYSGNGIGLAIAKRIIGRHGGRIWATGGVGKGATFHITLPKHALPQRDSTV